MTTQLSRIRNLCVTLIFFVATAGQAADLSNDYEWKPMKIGGGGYVVGMSINPAEPNLMYARADVSGAYRWIPATNSWKQLVTSSSMPAEYVGYAKYTGVDSIVGAPSDPNIAYMILPDQPYKLTPGQVFRSENRGDTWKATNFKVNGVRVEANGPARQDGERLAIDPVNSNVVYFSSTHEGLWMTENAGAAWKKVGEIPLGVAPHGVNTVEFDRTGGTSKSPDGTQRSKVAYVSVEEGGIFRTADAGATWQKISDQGAGDKGKPRDATVGPDGTYYVAYTSEKGSVGATWKYNVATGWADITPKIKQGGSNRKYWAVAADPFDPKHIVTMIHGGGTLDSTDQGVTWTFHGFTLKSPTISWLGTQNNNYLSTGELAFDAHEKGKLWFAEGFGVWWTRDLTAKDIPWTAASAGIEEACGNDVIAPPGGKPVGGMWDLGAFYFDDVDTYTAKRSQSTFMSAWALDWCPSDPRFVVAVLRSHLDSAPNAKSSGFSTDGGATWTRFPAIDKGTLPAELDFGVIAVSANNPNNIVWSPANGVTPYYTKDRGETWIKADFGGKPTGRQSYANPVKPLCADRVLPDTFYFYSPASGIFRSTDGGATFANIANPFPNNWNVKLKATPGQAGDLWFASGTGTFLHHSTDGGMTWKKVTGIESADNVGFGKANAGDYPTVFVAGNKGIFRSLDRGATWDKIGTYPLGIYDWIDSIDGDKDVFGKIYVAFAGSGFAYGTPKPAVK
jgi:photosystem II stability/assembly factor-like uncharacterized protein